MKLELKHLAPYLPYGLKLKENLAAGRIFKLRVLTKLPKASRNIYGVSIGNMQINMFAEEFKPILRPISDLIKEIEIEGEKFIPINVLSKFTSLHYSEGNLQEASPDGEMFDTEILHLSYYQITMLLSWHFNIFDLPKELWIDTNTLKL